MVALALNVPFLIAALSRYPGGISWTSLSGLYAGLVFVGYYVLILLVLLSLLFLVTGVSTRLFVGASAVLLTGALYYFTVNGVVYRMLRMHIDAFWLHYLFTTFGGLGIGPAEIAGGVALLAAIIALEWWIFRKAAAVRARKRWVVGLVAASLVAFAGSQVLHIAAYEANDSRITAMTPQLPFYYPVTSHQNAVKYGDEIGLIREATGSGAAGGPQSLRYPLKEVTCDVPEDEQPPNILVVLLESWRFDAMDSVVTPEMHDFSKRSSVFVNHFSTGNSTPAGVFPIFYGLHSTYWTAVKVNNPAIDNPVLIDVLEDNGYAFGIYADSHFERHKIKDTVFRGIPVQESFDGETVAARDRDLTDRLTDFMERQDSAGTPFFGFAFYKSTHYSYHSPPDSAPFQPTRELNVLLADGDEDRTPVLNDYRNSVHWVDRLVGDMLDRMEETGLLENTVVVITTDHGEEFDDNGENYWGHTGNFTQYQTRVPLILYMPGQEPRRVTEVTSNVDIPATLLEEGLGCELETESYSDGLNLFGPLPEVRPVITSSYVNHALILDDDVLVIWPMYVQRYKLDDIRETGGRPEPELVQRALREMARFYGAASP